MAIPVDQVVRERRFLAAHCEWQIFAQDRGSRWTAERDEPNHLVVALSLRELMDRLEAIVRPDE